jgi:hypothetical protein
MRFHGASRRSLRRSADTPLVTAEIPAYGVTSPTIGFRPTVGWETPRDLGCHLSAVRLLVGERCAARAVRKAPAVLSVAAIGKATVHRDGSGAKGRVGSAPGR